MKNNRKGLAELKGNNTTMVFTITLVLLILGLLMLLEYHAQRQSFRAQEQLTYKVDLTPNVDDNMARSLTDSIAALPYVRKAEYISKEEAAEIFSNEIGEDFVSFIGYNPLSPTIMVNFWAKTIRHRHRRCLSRTCGKLGHVALPQTHALYGVFRIAVARHLLHNHSQHHTHLPVVTTRIDTNHANGGRYQRLHNPPLLMA